MNPKTTAVFDLPTITAEETPTAGIQLVSFEMEPSEP